MMNKIFKNLLLIMLTLGLMCGSVLAHEQNYKGEREPHEDGTHKPDVEGGGGGTSDLAAAATNPIANLVQLQIQNQYTSDSYNVSGDSNAFILQPVNLFGQITYNPNDDTDEIAPEWIYKANVTFLFPG